ncbi:hypothetical protein HMI56_001617 [Coelomomyces lativittatus]|nr:hypothetical protein HMI56_001617 [Coelomomyces lativittatus]
MDSKGSSSSLLPFNPEKEPRSSSLLAPSSHLPTNTTSSTTSSSTPTMTTSMFMETTSYSGKNNFNTDCYDSSSLFDRVSRVLGLEGGIEIFYFIFILYLNKYGCDQRY